MERALSGATISTIDSWPLVSYDGHSQADDMQVDVFDADLHHGDEFVGQGYELEDVNEGPGNSFPCLPLEFPCYSPQETQTFNELDSLRLFAGTIGLSKKEIEGVARNAADQADGVVNSQQLPVIFFISSIAIQESLSNLGRDASFYEGIREVLLEQLNQIFRGVYPSEKAHTMLFEAALQIQVREDLSVCYDESYRALVDTLADLKEELEAESRWREEHTAVEKAGGSGLSGAEKEKFVCRKCPDKGFGRSADLERHNKQVHTSDDKKAKYICDYRKCLRHKQPFFRQDHFRDHLREFHKEDLPRRGVKPDSKWWKGRALRAIFGGWWRCNRCLAHRVDIRRDGYVCPGCGNHCELERQKYRETHSNR
ncbi:hypothetical protein B0H67DRAFT_647759 [Lasiosphaeris hirsuta]|uniref:C2H2-type domain-containing protein n=1 Tax=Lasiosphaeris hirsuta TaxID=260670 RepID=A0AA40A1Z3_9PEZI|nr:hypothetical protein B0H67DRAFT_647759 [Lasiosphaeris hirsuta]